MGVNAGTRAHKSLQVRNPHTRSSHGRWKTRCSHMTPARACKRLRRARNGEAAGCLSLSLSLSLCSHHFPLLTYLCLQSGSVCFCPSTTSTKSRVAAPFDGFLAFLSGEHFDGARGLFIATALRKLHRAFSEMRGDCSISAVLKEGSDYFSTGVVRGG